MTPRPVIVAVSQDMTVGAFLTEQADLPVSRIPIFEENIDHVTGFVLKTDILLAQAHDEPDTPLSSLRRDIRAIYSHASLSEVFEVLLEERQHVALVVDEYGGTDGLVTIEDLIETLLGMEIIDEADAEADMQRLARKQWERRASELGLDIASVHPNLGQPTSPQVPPQQTEKPTKPPNPDPADSDS